jgi:hypothetical protein
MTMSIALLFASVACLNASSLIYDNGAPAFENYYYLAEPSGNMQREADGFTLTSARSRHQRHLLGL